MVQVCYTALDYPKDIWRIRIEGPDFHKTRIILTNNMVPSATTIADLYKSRRRVEFFIKWIEQNLCIRYFVGTSAIAVET